MSKPRYFVAVFGNPAPPSKDSVESGAYHPDPAYAPFPPKIGDVLLLYCTAGYSDHSMQAPGIGIVLDKDESLIQYRWLPFAVPLTKFMLDEGFDSDDIKKFGNIRFSSHWLFEISAQSFASTVSKTRVAWDKL